MNKLSFMGVCATLLLTAPTVQAQHNHHIAGNIKADSHAPMGVMGDHIHKKGEWMISYRTMFMKMDGMRDGTDELSSTEVLTASAASPTDYAVTPTEMDTEMHMVGAMYAPSDDLTLMVMGNYLIRDMDHLTDGAVRFTTRSEGIGDTSVTGLYRLYEDDTHHLHANAGISLPTGGIEESDGTPAAPGGTRLPFKMQLGTGTLDLLPGVTYVGHHERFGWGSQYRARLHMGRNSNNYSLGDMHEISTWGSYRFADWISGSVRVTGKTEAEVDGNQLLPGMPMMIPTTDPDNYGGETIDLGFGVNLAGQDVLHNHRLGLEARFPVYQDLNGPQMQMDSAIVLGYQYSW